MRNRWRRNLLIATGIMLILLSLSACRSENMSKKEYVEQVVNTLGTVSEDFFVAIAEWREKAAVMDEDEARAGVEDMRGIIKRYDEIAQIDNPPKEYREVHEKLVTGLDNLTEALDTYLDSLNTGSDGTQLSDEENLPVSMDVEECIDEIAKVLDEMEDIS